MTKNFKHLEKMRAALRVKKFIKIEELEPERVELWANDGGEDTIHIEQESGFFQHCEIGDNGTGVRALRTLLDAIDARRSKS